MKTKHPRRVRDQKDSERYAGSPMGVASRYSPLADRTVTAHWGGDNSNGHRGIAKARRGAKKYINSRIRFREKAALRQWAADSNRDDDGSM